MIGINAAKQTPSALLGLKQHAIAAWVRGAVRDAMKNNVNVNARAKRLVKLFLARSFYNLIDGEVRGGGVLAVKEGAGNPNLVRDLNLRSNSSSHEVILEIV